MAKMVRMAPKHGRGRHGGCISLQVGTAVVVAATFATKSFELGKSGRVGLRPGYFRRLHLLAPKKGGVSC